MNETKDNAFYRADEEIEWLISDEVIPYEHAIDWMETRVEKIAFGEEKEAIWFLEHPPLYTAGTSAKSEDLLTHDALPVYKAGRGGQYTYHGPGQRIIYIMLDLNKRQKDVRAFITMLEDVMKAALEELNITAYTHPDRVGVWVKRENGATQEDKIGAIGVRLRKWVSFHGVSINIDPDLSHFDGIIPCGIHKTESGLGITSLWDLGHIITMPEFDLILHQKLEQKLGKISLLKTDKKSK